MSSESFQAFFRDFFLWPSTVYKKLGCFCWPPHTPRPAAVVPLTSLITVLPLWLGPSRMCSLLPKYKVEFTLQFFSVIALKKCLFYIEVELIKNVLVSGVRAKWFSYIFIYPYSDSFPIQVIVEYWTVFQVLYSVGTCLLPILI